MSMAVRSAPASRRSRTSLAGPSPPSRRSAKRRAARKFSRHGSTWKSSNAVTASPARSCQQRRCWRAILIRPMRISIFRCPVTYAVAALMGAFAPPSTRPPIWRKAVIAFDRSRSMGPQRHFNREAQVSELNPAGVVSRRTFVEVGVAGLLIGFDLFGAVGARAQSAANDVSAPNAYIRIGRDGRVTLFMQQIEMGQGTYTAQAMLIAEELEVDLAQLVLEAAPPNDRLYANKLLGFQVTGGSTSIRATWELLRRAGATARV